MNRRFLGDHLLNTGYNLIECSEKKLSDLLQNAASALNVIDTRYSIVVICSARSKHRAVFFIVQFIFRFFNTHPDNFFSDDDFLWNNHLINFERNYKMIT